MGVTGGAEPIADTMVTTAMTYTAGSERKEEEIRTAADKVFRSVFTSHDRSATDGFVNFVKRERERRDGVAVAERA